MKETPRVATKDGPGLVIPGSDSTGIRSFLMQDLEQNAKDFGMTEEKFKELVESLAAEQQYIEEQQEES